MRLLYLILIAFAAPVAAIAAWVRGLRNSANRERLTDRFGLSRIKFSGPVIWLHAASMGEVQAGASLVRRLQEKYPQHQILITTMTATGAARVRAIFGDAVTHLFLPYDLPFAVRGFLDHVRPQIAIILETELWPNLLRECRRRSIPICIASARISSRTAGRYKKFASLFCDVLSDGVIVAAQTEADAERFRQLGAAHVQVTGNIKFDIDIPDAAREIGKKFRQQLNQERFIWVAGSTHEGEETAAIEAHRIVRAVKPDALLILVPRHPQRFGEVTKLLAQSGMNFVTRSSGASVNADVEVLLIDTMGELLNFYAASDLAFVGGSLVPIGGHNLLEPAALGVATVCGPYIANTQESADILSHCGALVKINSVTELKQRVAELARDSSRCHTLGQRAQQAVQENRGALNRVMQLIEPLMTTKITR